MVTAPELQEQAQFFRAVFGQETGYVFISTLDRTAKDRQRGWVDRGFVYPLQLDAMLAHVAAADARGLDCYATAQLYREPNRRRKEFVKVCPSAWADLDTAVPWGIAPEPSVVLESSPGRWQAFWRTPTPMPPREAEELSRRIAYAHHRAGADLGGWDLTQVLRIPGTHNHKYPDQPVVRLAKCDPSPIPWPAFQQLPAAPARRAVADLAVGDGSEPPVALTGAELAHWQATSAPDRSAWAMRMVAILKEHGLADRLVEVALANHPIYLAKAREKWGNKESLIHDDIRRCLQRWHETPSVSLVIPVEGLRAPTAAVDGSAEPAESPVLTGYPLRRLATLLTEVEPHPTPLIDGLLWQERIHWTFAAPGAGKTLFRLAGALHVAAGQPFAGRPVQQCPVLLIEEDSPFSVLAEYTELLADLYALDLTALPFWVNQLQGLRITDAQGAALAWDVIQGCPDRPGLVLFDACERLVPSDRFTSRELEPFGRLLQRLVSTGCTVDVIDHTRKTATQPAKGPKSQVDPIDLLYGGRAKSAITDVMLYLSGSPRTSIQLTWPKFRGEPPPSLTVSFAPDTGFSFKDRPRTAQTPTEQKLLAWFAQAPAGWHSFAAILVSLGLAERSASRALEALARRGWIDKRGAHGGGTEYQATPYARVQFE